MRGSVQYLPKQNQVTTTYSRGLRTQIKSRQEKKSYKTLGVKAVNKYTLRVDLEHPMPYFNKMMTMAAFLPQSQDAIKKIWQYVRDELSEDVL